MFGFENQNIKCGQNSGNQISQLVLLFLEKGKCFPGRCYLLIYSQFLRAKPLSNGSLCLNSYFISKKFMECYKVRDTNYQLHNLLESGLF